MKMVTLQIRIWFDVVRRLAVKTFVKKLINIPRINLFKIGQDQLRPELIFTSADKLQYPPRVYYSVKFYKKASKILNGLRNGENCQLGWIKCRSS